MQRDGVLYQFLGLHGALLMGRTNQSNIGAAGILNMVMVLLLQVMPPRNHRAAIVGRTKQIHVGAAGGMTVMLLTIMPPR